MRSLCEGMESWWSHSTVRTVLVVEHLCERTFKEGLERSGLRDVAAWVWFLACPALEANACCTEERADVVGTGMTNSLVQRLRNARWRREVFGLGLRTLGVKPDPGFCREVRAHQHGGEPARALLVGPGTCEGVLQPWEWGEGADNAGR